MAYRFFPESGRQLTIQNKTPRVLGVAGVTIGPHGSRVISLRKVQGHPTNMTQLSTLVSTGDIQVSLTQDILNPTDLSTLDAPLSGEIWLKRDIFVDPPAADVNAIMLSLTAPTTDTYFSGTQLNGVVGTSELDYPRNITITGTTGVGEALDGGTAVVYGTDVDGQPMQEQIALSAIGASATVTDVGSHAFKQVSSVLIPADASISPGAYEIGFGARLGLSGTLSRAGLLAEFEDNAVPGVAGTIVLSPTSLPNGTYEPNNAPNGARDYVVIYIPG